MLVRALRLIALWTGVCGSLGAATSPGVWLDVPFVKQVKDGCGAASVAMIMQYWQQRQGSSFAANADPAAIQRALYSPRARGIYASGIEDYFRRNGFRTFAFEGSWPDLQQHLEKGRPLLLALQPGNHAPLHYVVLAGLDWQQETVLENDPAQRKLLKQDRAEFEREWKRAGNWMLLAVPLSNAPLVPRD